MFGDTMEILDNIKTSSHNDYIIPVELIDIITKETRIFNTIDGHVSILTYLPTIKESKHTNSQAVWFFPN
jgi:hypothetical protein